MKYVHAQLLSAVRTHEPEGGHWMQYSVPPYSQQLDPPDPQIKLPPPEQLPQVGGGYPHYKDISCCIWAFKHSTLVRTQETPGSGETVGVEDITEVVQVVVGADIATPARSAQIGKVRRILGSAKFDQKCQDKVNVGLRISNCKSVWDGFDEVKSRVYRRICINSR